MAARHRLACPPMDCSATVQSVSWLSLRAAKHPSDLGFSRAFVTAGTRGWLQSSRKNLCTCHRLARKSIEPACMAFSKRSEPKGIIAVARGAPL